MSERPSVNEDNSRLDELEIKFAFQQEMVEGLSAEVAKQWTAIDKLKRQIGVMHDQMANMAADEAGKPLNEPPPPHY